jgi:DNA modification methylase
MKLKDLAHNQKNPRTITDAKLAQLKKALLTFGDLSGIVFNRKSKQLVGGHQRTKHFDGDTEVVYTKKFTRPTKTGTVAEGYVELNGERFTYREVEWDRPTELAANIAANKGAGEWDLPELGAMLKELSHFDLDFDMDLTMHDADELQEFEGITVKEHTRTGATGVDEDDVPEPKAARAKTGDIYRLGSHRLMCGDSGNAKHLEKLMKGAKVDIVFTDPPYGISYQSNMRTKSKKFSVIENDQVFLTEWVKHLPLVSQGWVFVWTAWKVLAKWQEITAPIGELTNVVVWDKGGGGIGDLTGTFATDYEVALVFNRGAKITGKRLGSVWSIGKDSAGKYVHPTQKPVELAETAIENVTIATASVLDLFGGSGSTLIACEKTLRNCFMMEIDPHYVDVIIERWENYTGKKAKLVHSFKTKLNKPVKQAEIRANG